MEYDLREYERQVDKDSAQTMKAYEKNGSIYPKKSICHDFKKMVNYVHALHIKKLEIQICSRWILNWCLTVYDMLETKKLSARRFWRMRHVAEYRRIPKCIEVRNKPLKDRKILRGLFSLKEIGAVDYDLTGSIDPVFLDIGFLHGDPAFLKHPGHLRAIAVEDPIQLFVCGYMREYFDIGVISQSRMMAVAAFNDHCI